MNRRTRFRRWLSTTIAPDMGQAPQYQRTVWYCHDGGHSVIALSDETEHVLCHCKGRETECEMTAERTVTGERS